LLEETGRIDNFRRAAGKIRGPFRGAVYNDSDVYKWVEAVAWALAGGDEPELATMLAATIEEIAAAQQPDGYLNTYFMFERAAERWQNLRDRHELYCAGHLFQAAIAHYRVTGSSRLLDVAIRLADHIAGVFGPAGRVGVPGHPEIEMALVELARTTGRLAYLELARAFVDNRGRGLIGGSPYHQDHRPLRQMDWLAGHAVRGLYLAAGAADLVAEAGDLELHDALTRLWQNMVASQLYVTGGLGARHQGEAFGRPFELPNSRAYAESCAAVASIYWCWRMLAITADARYADLLELTLYNALLAGLAHDGQHYFYANPLASDGSQRRQPWFECACCPPNIARLLASLPAAFYAPADEGVWIHLYGEGRAEVRLPDGRRITLVQHTHYPWDGQIHVEVTIEEPSDFSLFLRLPGWCEAGASLLVNGERWAEPGDGSAPRRKVTGALQSLQPGSYVEVYRRWRSGDTVQLRLPMAVRRLESHPYLFENQGRVALMRGPLLYCVEHADNPGLDPRDIRLVAGEPVITFARDLLGGLVILALPAVVSPPQGWQGQLYRSSGAESAPAATPATITAIPYFAWANREPGGMQIFLATPPEK
jgi:DUF1680 family protein